MTYRGCAGYPIFLLSFLFYASSTFASLPFISHQVATPVCVLNNVCFAYDHSGSIDDTEFQQEVQFITSIATEIASIAPNVSFSAVAFSSSAQIVQASTTDLSGIFIPSITSFSQLGGGTNIGSGLRLCLDEVVGRTGTRSIILLTDGQDVSGPALAVAEEARNEGVAVATVGILPDVDRPFLEGLATRPEFFSEAVFSELPNIVNRVVNATCESTRVVSCQIDDVCFAIDSSNSVDATEFDQQRDFVIEIATIIESRNASTTFSAHTFDDDVLPVLPMGTMDLLGTFIPRVEALMTSGGSTNMFAGLRSCFEDLNNRTGNRMVVIVTDGRDNNNPRALRGREAILDAGIGILTVGVGSGVNLGYLNRLTTVPGSVVNVSSFGMLESAVDVVADSVCNMTASPPPMPADSCEERFNGCLLRFRGTTNLSMFPLRRRGQSFTTQIVTKFGAQFPGRWRSVRSFMVNSDGTTTMLRRQPFRLSQNNDFYRVTRNIADNAEAERFGGKCVLLDIELRRASGSTNQCVVFRVRRF